MIKINKTGITIKSGNTTRLGLLNRVLDLTDKLVTPYDGENRRYLSEQELIATTQVYKMVAETVSTVNTNGQQGVSVSNCCFTGMDTGLKVEQSPNDHLEENDEEYEIEDDYDDEE
jgi:hypothetical protein